MGLSHAMFCRIVGFVIGVCRRVAFVGTPKKTISSTTVTTFHAGVECREETTTRVRSSLDLGRHLERKWISGRGYESK